MTIRIDRIKINRGGPLSNDFEFESGDLNLIYGGNESGKTYVVESIIQFLFQSSSKSSTSWNIRKWDGGGRIIVSGLESDPVSFTRTNKKRFDEKAFAESNKELFQQYLVESAPTKRIELTRWQIRSDVSSRVSELP